MIDSIYSKRYRQVQYMGNKLQNEIHFLEKKCKGEGKGKAETNMP